MTRARSDDVEVFTYALTGLQDKLFAFDRAYELLAAWLLRHPDDVVSQVHFAVAHFTTGRFGEARSRLAALRGRNELAKGATLALHAIELAALVAAGRMDDMRSQLPQLRATIAAQPADFRIVWNFAGPKHFISNDPRLATHRQWLLDFLTALEANDRAAILIAVDPVIARAPATARLSR